MLSGPALYIIPDVGPLFIAGQLASVLADMIEGAILLGSASALGAALISVGIPHDSIVEFESAIKTGKYMMIVHGEFDALKQAR